MTHHHRDLADLVHVAASTEAAAQRRVDGPPRDPAQVLAGSTVALAGPPIGPYGAIYAVRATA
jgi:hypothetical protein